MHPEHLRGFRLVLAPTHLGSAFQLEHRAVPSAVSTLWTLHALAHIIQERD